jgi:hypothetical protein
VIEDLVVTETRTDVVASFTGCACVFRFNKTQIAEGKMNICCTYCKNYPSCKRALCGVFDAVRERLIAEAESAFLVIPDEDGGEVVNAMDWTGMI